MGDHVPHTYFVSPYQFQRGRIIGRAAAIGAGERYLITPEQVVHRYGNADARLGRGKKEDSASTLHRLECLSYCRCGPAAYHDKVSQAAVGGLMQRRRRVVPGMNGNIGSRPSRCLKAII